MAVEEWSGPVSAEVMATSFNLPIALHSSAIEAPSFKMRALDRVEFEMVHQV